MTASTGQEGQTTTGREKYYTPLELAAKLKVHRRTILKWVKDPDHPIQGVKLSNTLWRITASSVEDYLEKVYGNGKAG